MERHTTSPEKITAAARHAQREAERQVRELESHAVKVEQANLAAQRDAAALRLNREVGRLLRCLDATAVDLAQLAAAQAARTGPLAERVRQAKEWLGGRFDWTPQLVWELEQFPSYSHAQRPTLASFRQQHRRCIR